MRVGLVLGGGGVVGLAYHAAALAAIEHDLGWDPRDADVIVGTSAGSIVGALLRRGVPASDLAALTVGATPFETPPDIAMAVQTRHDFPTPNLRQFARLQVPNVRIMAAWARRPWRLDPAAALTSMLADGKVDLAEHAADQLDVFGTDWPTDPLWLCAVRQDDLRRTVIGRDVEAPLSHSVMASCAIPGYFRPVSLAGVSYVDGGVRSPTNADVLRREALDLVIIVSPMSGRRLPRLHPAAALRRYAAAKVSAEKACLRDHGIPTVVIEPGAEAVDALGHDFMSHDHLTDIVTAAFFDTGEQLQKPFTRTLLAGLHRRHDARLPRTGAAAAPPAA